MMKLGFTTSILHASDTSNIEFKAVHPPMHTSMAFGYDDARELARVFQGQQSGFVYGRQGNPTAMALEDKVNKMEGGVATVCFSSGMSAITNALMALLVASDHLVCSHFLFGNTNSFFSTLARLGIDITYVDATDADQVAAAITAKTRLVFVETIANPATQVADLARIGEICAQRGVLFLVDNTMTSPYLFQPATVKAGLVVNSLTKYIGGHGNALGGSITDTGVFDWTQYPNILPNYRVASTAMWGITQIRKKGLRDIGCTLAAEPAHRLAIGAETLALRMDRSCDNALKLATWLESQPQIRAVHYPGLASHAQHALSTQLFKAYGALMSIELIDSMDCFDFLNRLKRVIISSHLGDNRTLAIPVAHTIFWEMGAQRRSEMGISDGMIRLSIGIEDYADLQEDFRQALESST